MTRDELEKGPKFEEDVRHTGCLVCGEVTGTWTEVDKNTGLCRPCWRVWRFSIAVMHPWLLRPTFIYAKDEGAAPACPSCGGVYRQLAAIDSCTDPWHQEKPAHDLNTRECPMCKHRHVVGPYNTVICGGDNGHCYCLDPPREKP